MNDDISWTMELGEAFLAQDKELFDAIQNMRGKAQKAGTLQTSPQQIVTVTNMIVEKTVEEKVVVVTNTVVQIEPSSSTTVYVPTYNPYTAYYPPPAYYANPYPLLTFGAGMAMGAIIANNCDWNHGGCYNNNVNVNVDRAFHRNTVSQSAYSVSKREPPESLVERFGKQIQSFRQPSVLVEQRVQRQQQWCQRARFQQPWLFQSRRRWWWRRTWRWRRSPMN